MILFALDWCDDACMERPVSLRQDNNGMTTHSNEAAVKRGFMLRFICVRSSLQ